MGRLCSIKGVYASPGVVVACVEEEFSDSLAINESTRYQSM